MVPKWSPWERAKDLNGWYVLAHSLGTILPITG
jgi:hypothetical protein